MSIKNRKALSLSGLYLIFFGKYVVCLAVKSSQSGVVILRVDIEFLVFDVVIPFLKFPMDILCLEDLSDTCLKDQGVVDPGYHFSLKYAFEFNAPVGKRSEDRKRILFLGSFLLGPSIDDGSPSYFSSFIRPICSFISNT